MLRYYESLLDPHPFRFTVLPRSCVEEDGDTVTVYGAGEPIARHRSDWLRWLKAGGAALLRERCNKLERAS